MIEMGIQAVQKHVTWCQLQRKTNINNVKDNQNGRKNMIEIGQFKKQYFYQKFFIFPASLFHFRLFTLFQVERDCSDLCYRQYQSLMVRKPIHKKIISSLITTNIISKRHLSAECEYDDSIINLYIIIQKNLKTKLNQYFVKLCNG